MGYWIAIGAIVGGVISAYGESESNDAQIAQRRAISQAGLDAVTGMNSRAVSGDYYGFGLDDIFGTKVDPEAALYHPVDITDSQRQTILGNLANFDDASKLAELTSDKVVELDMKRMRTLFPNFDENLEQFSGVTGALLRGQNPYGDEDVLNIVSDRSSLAGALGTPGGSFPATLKDLGLNRIDLGLKGAGLFQDFLRSADAISPLNAQFRPQQSFLNPSERLQADIRQRENEQQANLTSAIIAASPDPAAAGLFGAEFQARLGLAGAELGSSINLGNPYAAIGQGVSTAAAAYGQYNRNQQNQQQYGYAQNPYQGQGTGATNYGTAGNQGGYSYNPDYGYYTYPE
jgi:hypothetical protein